MIPVHGEQKHLMKHAGLAEQMGIAPENILIAQNGLVIELTRDKMTCSQTVPAGRVLVDGLSVGDVGSIVLRDRKHLADDGVIIVNLAIDRVTREIVAGPEVVSRGFVYVRESEELMREITEVVEEIIDRCYYNNIRDYNTLKTRIKDGVSKHLLVKSKRTPMVLPIILEV